MLILVRYVVQFNGLCSNYGLEAISGFAYWMGCYL